MGLRRFLETKEKKNTKREEEKSSNRETEAAMDAASFPALSSPGGSLTTAAALARTPSSQASHTAVTPRVAEAAQLEDAETVRGSKGNTQHNKNDLK